MALVAADFISDRRRYRTFQLATMKIFFFFFVSEISSASEFRGLRMDHREKERIGFEIEGLEGSDLRVFCDMDLRTLRLGHLAHA